MRGEREKEKQNKIKMKGKGVEDELSQMLLAPYEGELPQMSLAQEKMSLMSLHPCSPDMGKEKENKMKGKSEEEEAHMEIRKMSLENEGARNYPPVSNVAFKTSNDASHVSVNVSDLERSLATSLYQKLLLDPKQLRSSSASPSCCIHKVPQHLRQGSNDENYNPQIISIGPFHRGKKSLQAMEEHKLKYLQALVSRTGNNSLEEYVMTVQKLEERARECYSKIFTNLESSEFVEMMVLDGCFIIMLLCKANNKKLISSDDPIFNLPWLKNRLQTDLLLSENQIPYFVLQHLFENISAVLNEGHSLADLAAKFFSNIVLINNGVKKTKEESNPNQEIQHLLHLFHSNLIPMTKEEKFNQDLKMIHSVTELHEGGIEFKKGEKDICFLDIEFGNGVIKIPPLKMEDSTNCLLRNFIAFEQCYSHCGRHITTYVTFMDCLINSSKDVECLFHKGIIDNWLGSGEEVANLFNKIKKGVVISPDKFYLADVFRRIDKYCSVPCHKWRATLMHNYFHNPWAIISLIAGIILLLLAIIQTIFSAMSL